MARGNDMGLRRLWSGGRSAVVAMSSACARITGSSSYIHQTKVSPLLEPSSDGYEHGLEFAHIHLHPSHVRRKGLQPLMSAFPMATCATALACAKHLGKKLFSGPSLKVTIDGGVFRASGDDLCLTIELLKACACSITMDSFVAEFKTTLIVIMEAHGSTWAFTCSTGCSADLMLLLSANACAVHDLPQYIDLEFYGKVLGAGSFGKVYLGRTLSGQVPVAVKEVAVHQNAGSMDEASLLLRAQGHASIIKFHGLFSTSDGEGYLERRAIVLAYHSHGDLFKYVVRLGPMMEQLALVKISDLLGALSHIHARDIFHRDVKPENLLVTNHGKLVLTDFGIAVSVRDCEAMSSRMGTPGYASPEMLAGTCTDARGDVFAAGAVLFFMLSGIRAFGTGDIPTILKRTMECAVDWDALEDYQVSQNCMVFLRKMITPEARNRSFASAALSELATRFDVGVGKQSQPKVHANLPSRELMCVMPRAHRRTEHVKPFELQLHRPT